MIETKPWYLSRTVWASLVTIALAVANYSGMAAGGLQQDALVDAALELATTVSGLIALFGRLQATTRIG
ncbi:MAG: hypothetical protein M9924_01705 [Rhizobiaceae bacterium]|nr:hypothetical protein [Rhizobiaceae bacterium]